MAYHGGLIQPPMFRDHLLHFLRRRFAWLLAAALLLPVAQAVAAAHAVSHDCGTAQQAGGEKSHLQHCPLCTAAAVLGNNVLPGTPAQLALAPAAHAVVPATAWLPAAAVQAHLPPSRGPPASFA